MRRGSAEVPPSTLASQQPQDSPTAALLDSAEVALETSWVTHGGLWATLGRLGRALGRPEVALERSSVTFGTLWVTLGRLLVHFRSLLVPKSSSKGSLGGSKKVLFLKKVILNFFI